GSMVSKTRVNKNNVQKAQKAVAKVYGKHLDLVVGSPLAAPSSCDIQPRCLGLPRSAILTNTTHSKTGLPFSTEVKVTSGKTIPFLAWYSQASSNSSNGEEPLVVVYPRRARGQRDHQMLAIVDFEYLVKLIVKK